MRHGAGSHDCVVYGLVAVAVHEHYLARLQERHEHRLVGGRCSVRHVTTQRAAEYFGRHLLRLRERRLRFGAGEVSKGFHGNGKVGTEYHRSERLVQSTQERRVSERIAAVVPGRVPVRPRLDLHVLPHCAPEARQPERLEQMDYALTVELGS